MISLIEVKCPHCGAQGQIMLPPPGAMIVGPCPECQEMVVIFCGKVLPLDKDIMTKSSDEEQKEHLLETIGVFVHDRIERLFDKESSPSPAERVAMNSNFSEHENESAEGQGSPAEEPEAFASIPQTPISQDELDSFLKVELKLLDNPDYFKAVFE